MTSRPSDELAKAWDEKPDILRGFIEIRPQYEQLCSEVAYILKKRMDESGIEYSAITCRAKTLKSFAEKLVRKQYGNPLKDVTDLAGVRLVYLYKSDRLAIEKIIEAEFDIIEKVDKVEEQEADRFGYGALHYLVHLGRKSSGARYDDLKGLICEVQVRTVLQDAWAIIDHHLSYKQESDVPKVLRRKLNSLSGLFETADDQFDRVRIEREEYRDSVKDSLQSEDISFDQELNLDSFAEFLKWYIPEKPPARDDDHLSHVLSNSVKFGYKSLSDLQRLLERTRGARSEINSELVMPFAASEVAIATALLHPEYRELFSRKVNALIEKYEHLLS